MKIWFLIWKYSCRRRHSKPLCWCQFPHFSSPSSTIFELSISGLKLENQIWEDLWTQTNLKVCRLIEFVLFCSKVSLDSRNKFVIIKNSMNLLIDLYIYIFFIKVPKRGLWLPFLYESKIYFCFSFWVRKNYMDKYHIHLQIVCVVENIC